jgi:hypothetical protein
VEQLTPGKGSPQRGGRLGRGHCEHGGLEHKPVAGGIDGLCQEHAAWAYRIEARVAVQLGYPHPGRLGEVTCTLLEPCQPQW